MTAPRYDLPSIDASRQLVYKPVEGREQPPPHNGFVRSKDDNHKFVEFILPCDHRRVEVTRRATCGAIQFHYYGHSGCPLKHTEVSSAKCMACPSRTVNGEVVPPPECDDCDEELTPIEWGDDCDECLEHRKQLQAVYAKERERLGLPVYDLFGVEGK